jgi:broad specificity phosphatase PhoE
VAHKGVIRVAIGALLGPDTSRPLSLDLGSISWLRLRDGGAAQAVALDRVDHLGDDRVEEE